ncbi:3-beta-hydroxysteroid sulfotransferase-like [Diretmus argenteus]
MPLFPLRGVVITDMPEDIHNHSQKLAFSPSSDISLMALWSLAPCSPTSLRRRDVEPPMKPLVPTSTGTNAAPTAPLDFSRALTTVMWSDRFLMYDGLPLPKEISTMESMKYAQDFPVKDTNVFAVTYPRSGTTWMQEILPLVLNGGDLTPIQTIPSWDRVPWLEDLRLEVVIHRSGSTPRAMVTFLPYHLMPTSFYSSKAKVIYLTRNPKDVMVSSYYYHQRATSYHDDPGTFQEFIDNFLEGKVPYGKWTDHVKSWRHTELGDRILYITYEEMLQDLDGSIRRFSDFLGTNLNEEAIQRIAQHCSLNSMKTNPMSNYSLITQDLMDFSKSPFFRKENYKARTSHSPGTWSDQELEDKDPGAEIQQITWKRGRDRGNV